MFKNAQLHTRAIFGPIYLPEITNVFGFNLRREILRSCPPWMLEHAGVVARTLLLFFPKLTHHLHFFDFGIDVLVAVRALVPFLTFAHGEPRAL